MRSAGLLATFALISIVLSHGATADTSYWRTSTNGLTVISNGSAKRCEKLAFQFLVFQQYLRDLTQLDQDSSFPPLTVYSLSDSDAHQVFLTEADKKQQTAKNMRIYSKYLPGSDTNIAAIVDIGGSDEPLQSVLLIYARSVLQTGPGRGFPAWYVTGVSDITNGLLIRDDGSILLSREASFKPVVDKTVRTKYDLGTLLAATYKDVASGGDWEEFSNRAREWAQYGLLTTPDRRTHYRELAILMRQGTPANEAVNQAFGLALPEVAKDFEDGRWHHDAVFKIPPPKTPLTVPSAQAIDAAQAKAALQVLADRVVQQPLNP
jgi:hypothetical protein